MGGGRARVAAGRWGSAGEELVGPEGDGLASPSLATTMPAVVAAGTGLLVPPPGVAPGARPVPRLLDALRERLRYMHGSLRTEEAYVHWARDFVRWASLADARGHPRDLGLDAVRGCLVTLANERRVAAATHRQALSALLLLYREVMGIVTRVPPTPSRGATTSTRSACSARCMPRLRSTSS